MAEVRVSAAPQGSLVDALRQRGETARTCAFKCDFYALPQAAQDALYGLAALVEDAADEIERLRREV